MRIIKILQNKIKNKIIHELTKNEQREKKEYLKKNPPITDEYYLLDDVKEPVFMKHQEWFNNLINQFNKPGIEVLEIGSREVTGKSTAREAFNLAIYTGFDYHAGPNVDIVGDVHKLSTYFDKKYDLIYSSSCFEHFAMPWQAATEINKLLKVGGHIFIETHFSYRSHERPWNFFQFSDLGLQILFSKAMGFECIDKGMTNPIVGRFSKYSDEYLRYIPIKGLYCHSQYFAVKKKNIERFDWSTVALEDLVNNTIYPETTVMM
jgi:hypothetical protein